MTKYGTSYHLIDGGWKRMLIPDVTDHHNLIKMQLKLQGKKIDKIVLLENDGTGWITRPIININECRVPREEMILIQLSAEDISY